MTSGVLPSIAYGAAVVHSQEDDMANMIERIGQHEKIFVAHHWTMAFMSAGGDVLMGLH